MTLEKKIGRYLKFVMQGHNANDLQLKVLGSKSIYVFRLFSQNFSHKVLEDIRKSCRYCVFRSVFGSHIGSQRKGSHVFFFVINLSLGQQISEGQSRNEQSSTKLKIALNHDISTKTRILRIMPLICGDKENISL